MRSLREKPASGDTQAVVLVKAAPQVGQRHGETVCCAGLDLQGSWLRLYPVSFRTLDEGQRFGRWDRIRFKWRAATDDPRIESRRIEQHSIEIVGHLKPPERERFLAKSIVTGLEKERTAGRSLALLKAEIVDFKVQKKDDRELHEERARFDALHSQKDLFNAKALIPYEPCPYRFKYEYRTNDGMREGTCQDWEIEATFYRWSRKYGERHALAELSRVFGHDRYPDTWLINGVVRMDEVRQLSML
jgi:hypothetical protein